MGSVMTFVAQSGTVPETFGFEIAESFNLKGGARGNRGADRARGQR